MPLELDRDRRTSFFISAGSASGAQNVAVAPGLLDVRGVAELDLEHQLEVVERAADALGAGRDRREQRVGVERRSACPTS